MNFDFATYERRRALHFLKQIFPDSIVEDETNSVKDLLDLIEADEIRVCDPDFHRGVITQGRNWKGDESREAAREALEKSGLIFADYKGETR